MKVCARASWSIVLAFAVVTGLSARATASHHVFSYSVDRFEVDGNVFGTFDGTLDYVDEFDDGTIAPDWSPLLGTNVEAGGVVTLKNPGTDYTIGSVSVDVSNIENEEAVVNGSGDFTATAYWLPFLAETDQEFHFQLYELGPLIESAGLSVGSASATVPPAIAGPAISQALTQISGSYDTLEHERQLVQAQDPSARAPRAGEHRSAESGCAADTNFSFGNGAEYCSSSAGAAIDPNNARIFKAKDALASPACNVPACPP